MIKKNPPTPANKPQSASPPAPNITMTPVGFSPSSSQDAIGTVMPAPRPEMRFTLFVPVAIILLTLIFSTVRDIVALNKRMSAIKEEDTPALAMLKNAPKEADLAESLHAGLQKLAPTDPVAVRVLTEYFPPPTPNKTSNPDTTSSSPAK